LGASSGSGASNANRAITGRVTLDPTLRDRVGPNDTLFVFARAVNGPRIPLAVERTKAGAFPHAFRLDDSMAMAPGSTLSKASDVIVEARISKSGNATPSPGDLEGKSGAIKPGVQDVAIVIDNVVR
jgi:cytochrome c-type biogenesis protein CcmH